MLADLSRFEGEDVVIAVSFEPMDERVSEEDF